MYLCSGTDSRIVDLENRIPENEPVFLLRAQDKFVSLIFIEKLQLQHIFIEKGK
jgi:archaellum component FlaD/FlaE